MRANQSTLPTADDLRRKLPLIELMPKCGDGAAVKKSAHCIFHEDKRKSFSVFEKDNRWFWKCHTGCGEGDELDYLKKKFKLDDAGAFGKWRQLAGLNGSDGTTKHRSAKVQKSAEATYRCNECDNEVSKDEIADCDPLYECGECGSQLVGERRCPDCNKFCARVGDHGCPECGAGALELVQSQETTREAKPAEKTAVKRSAKTIVAEYDYTDDTGKGLFQSVRYEPKDFRQRRPDGKGGWLWNLKDTPLVPYHLPEILTATTVRITEGEKDTDNLRAFDLTATCNPMGAGKWRPEFNQYFHNKDVLVYPDNDDPGRKHADTVARQLMTVAKSVRIVTAPAPAKDVSDHIEVLKKNPGCDVKAELLKLEAAAPVYQVPTADVPRVVKLAAPAKPITFDEWRAIVLENFPALVEAAIACGSVVCQLLLNDCHNPFALVLVDVPSSGKTITLNFFGLPELVYPTDNFTPAAFVSHASNVKREELDKVDMLPRIRFKAMLVRDLAPVFGANEDDLLKQLGILTRTLDGEGLQIDSGVHGQRGYSGDYQFMLLAGSTPIPPRVFKIMGNLGSRLFFLALHTPMKDEDELMEQNRGVDRKAKENACRAATDAFLRTLWSSNQGGVDWDKAGNPDDVLRVIAKCSRILACLRGAINVWAVEEAGERLAHSIPTIENPDRINCLLYNLARGHAVLCGRRQLTTDDLSVVLNVTFDSAPTIRAKVFRKLIDAGGVLLTSDVTKLLSCSAPTARKEMEALCVLGVTDKTKEADPDNGRPETEIVLAAKFGWFATDDCQRLRSGTATQGGNLFKTPAEPNQPTASQGGNSFESPTGGVLKANLPCVTTEASDEAVL